MENELILKLIKEVDAARLNYYQAQNITNIYEKDYFNNLYYLLGIWENSVASLNIVVEYFKDQK